MANAKKLPSGNYRIRVFSHKDEDGKAHYESFTAKKKSDAEHMAKDFLDNRERMSDCRNWTLGEAIDKYIEQKSATRSPTTIHGYEKIRRTAFQEIMDIPLRKVTDQMLNTAIRAEMDRPTEKGGKQRSAKSVINAYGLVSAALAQYLPGRTFRVDLPKKSRRIRTLPEPSAIYAAIRGTDIELPCLLAMWLSFTESEIRGLTKSKSIDGDYITIREVVVQVGTEDVRKSIAKQDTRIRRHRMPARIKELINQVDGDVICPIAPTSLRWKLGKCLTAAGLPHITFHDLRHVNASVMAMLHIPDKYAQERGGWKTDHIMKTVYTETFDTERQRVDDLVDNYFDDIISAG